jgi:hypothetical protein
MSWRSPIRTPAPPVPEPRRACLRRLTGQPLRILRRVRTGRNRRQPPSRRDRPTMPFRMIMTTANTVSRVRVGLFSPCSMIAAMLMTSINVTDSVSSNVPYGSPRRRAKCSACRTTESADANIAANSHRKMSASHRGSGSSRKIIPPSSRNATQVAPLTARDHSWRAWIHKVRVISQTGIYPVQNRRTRPQ